MKIGTLIFILFLALVSLGYFLSENINTNEQLAQAQQQIVLLSKDNKALQAERDTARLNLVNSEQRVAELTQKNLALADQILTLNKENVELKKEIGSLQEQRTVFQKTYSDNQFTTGSLGYIIPLFSVPVSLAGAYMIIYHNKHMPILKREKKSGQEDVWARLTKDEIKQLMHLRRQTRRQQT